MATADERAGEAAKRPALGAEWPMQAANQIESAVEMVRDRAVRPLRSIARVLVFGLFAALLAVVLVVLVTLGLVRVFNVYVFPGRVWATYALAGGIFVLFGAFLWFQRRSR